MQEILGKMYFGNTVLKYSVFAAVMAVGMVALWGVKYLLVKLLKKWADRTENKIDDFVVESARKFLLPVLYYILLLTALSTLHTAPLVNKAVSVLGALIFTVVGIMFVKNLIFFLVFQVYLRKHPDGENLSNRFRALSPALTAAIWVGGLIFLLDNLGLKISAIITGLGIGGVAVAIAASTILGELFSYFSIMLDRPFVIGDFIVVGDFMGTVEKIGIKSTWLTSLSGERLIFSNKDLTDSRIRNFKKMQRRRVVFRINVTYDTPIEKLKEIPEILKQATLIKDALFDRSHFAAFADSNFAFEVVYYVLSSDYNKYMDLQQAINFTILEEFAKRGIQFAYPTQTLHVATLPGNSNPVATDKRR